MKEIATEKIEFFESKVTGIISVFDQSTKKLVSRPRMDEIDVNIQTDGLKMLGVKITENGRDIYLSLVLSDLVKLIEKVAKELTI